MSNKRIKWTQNLFIETSNNIHFNKYCYSNILFITINHKVEIICPYDGHGNFWQTAYNHIIGKGCPKCKYLIISKKHTKTIENFIEKANDAHNFKYDYFKVEYKRNNVKVEIICPIHGSFLQTPLNHLSGSECPICGYEIVSQSLKLSEEQFIIRCSNVHDNKYDYSEVEYIDCRNKIIIICPIHGKFQQIPYTHMAGRGCPKCAKTISKSEIAWLDFLGIPQEYRQARIKIDEKLIKPDAYDPITNTIYEFYGDFWHGNPDLFNFDSINYANQISFGELYNKTINRENMIKNAGYNIVSIWENDWKNYDDYLSKKS